MIKEHPQPTIKRVTWLHPCKKNIYLSPFHPLIPGRLGSKRGWSGLKRDFFSTLTFLPRRPRLTAKSCVVHQRSLACWGSRYSTVEYHALKSMAYITPKFFSSKPPGIKKEKRLPQELTNCPKRINSLSSYHLQPLLHFLLPGVKKHILPLAR